MRCDTQVSISFVAPNGFAAISGGTGHIGGSERQQSLMARWFASRGYKVSLITWDEGHADKAAVAGVWIITMCRRDVGIRGVRFFHPRWTSLARALSRADADIYCYRCADLGLGQVALWCRRNQRKCVYFLASDPNCDPRLPTLRPLRERILYRYGLLHAHRIITQTKRQQEMLREGFGLTSTSLPMPCEDFGPIEDYLGDSPMAGSVRVLWVGRIAEEKRLELLLDIAERCSEIIFDVVGSSNIESPYASAIVDRAAGIPNVLMHGTVPHCEMVKFYRRASCLCCTSAFEGFPNTFLEAWSYGLPVISTFDPDGLIVNKGLGWVGRDAKDLAIRLRKLAASPEMRKSIGAAARNYFLENHAIDRVMPQFEKVLLNVLGTTMNRRS